MPRIVDRGRCDAVQNGPQSYSNVGHVLSPIPAGLPYLTGGPLVSPSPVGASGSIPWAKMPLQFGSPPSAAGADTGLEGIFPGPVPHGLSHHPLWSPSGAAYHVTGGAFREGASNMSFFNRYSSPSHLTIDQLQYLSSLLPVSTSSTPPCSLLLSPSSHGFCSPLSIHQGAASGPTSPAWLTEQQQHHHSAGLSAAETARYQDMPLNSSVTSSLNRHLLDYYKGLLANGNVPPSPVHQVPSMLGSSTLSRDQSDQSQSSTCRVRAPQQTAGSPDQNNRRMSSTGRSNRDRMSFDDGRTSRSSTPRHRHQRRLWNNDVNTATSSTIKSESGCFEEKSSSLLNVVRRMSPDKTSKGSSCDDDGRVSDKSFSESKSFRTINCVAELSDRKQNFTKSSDAPLHAIISSPITAGNREDLEEEDEIDVCAVVDDDIVSDSLRTEVLQVVPDRVAVMRDDVIPGKSVRSVEAKSASGQAEWGARRGCHGSPTPSSWRAASDNGHDVKPSLPADRRVTPSVDASSMTSRYDGGNVTQRSDWNAAAPELGRLHVMTHPVWDSNPAPPMRLPPGHHKIVSPPFLPGSIHPANYGLLEPSLPHLFDNHRLTAASGMKLYPDPVTGQCYFFPEFGWPNIYDRSRCYEESLVNLASLLSPTASDCLERKVKCEQLSPATPVPSGHLDSERKPNSEQLRLSLASNSGKSECPNGSTRRHDHRQRTCRRDEVGWPGVVRREQPWTNGRTVAVESRGTSPLVDHCKLDPDGEVKVKVFVEESAVDLSLSDSAIDLSVQSNNSSTVSAVEKELDRKRTGDVEHSDSLDIPVASDTLKATDAEVDSIMDIVDMTSCVASSADRSARDVTVGFPIGYELERITPVDEVESTSYPSVVACLPSSDVDSCLSSEQPAVVANGSNDTLDEATTSGLDILSTVACERPISAAQHTSEDGGLVFPVPRLCEAAVAGAPSRQFSILDLPLSEMIESQHTVDESLTAVDSGYNGPPTVKCSTDNDSFDDDHPTTNGRLAVRGVSGARQRVSVESASETKSGDAFSSLKVDCGADNMDPMELDMRMRMADLQVKYREKQRELAKLQRRRSVGSTDCTSGAESRSASRKSTGGCRSRSNMKSFAVAKENTGHKIAGKSLCKDASLSPTFRNVFDDVMADRKLTQTSDKDKCRKRPELAKSVTCRKQKKTERTDSTDDCSKKPAPRFLSGRKGRSPASSARRKSMTNEGRMPIKSNGKARTSDDKRQPSREDSPGFYADEWYRRRSERIFLHKTTDDLSPTRPKFTSNLSPTATKRSSNGVSVTSSATKNCDAVAYNSRPSLVNGLTSDAVLFGPSYRIESSTGTEMNNVPANRKMTGYDYSSSSDSSSSSSISSSDDDEEDSDLSDADDMPLSAYINRNITLVNKTSALQQEDIVSGLRVLFLKDGLFFEGTVNELMPPDVYGVSIDGERGNRPNIVSREELLQQSVLIVRPSSSKDLSIGSRVCAYWSQKFSCLHPGTVCKPNSDSSTDGEDDDIRVDFDDGDAGKIPVDFIRMLPPDFAVQDKNRNSMFAKTPRKRRIMSGDASSESKNCVDADLSPESSRWKRGRFPIRRGCNAVDNPSSATVMTLENSPSSELKLTIRRSVSCSTGNEQDLEKDDEVKESDDEEVDSSDSEDAENSSSRAEESESEVEEPRKKQMALNRTGRRRKRLSRKGDRDSSGSGVEMNRECPASHCVKKRKRSSAESGKKRQRKRSSSGSEVGSFLPAWQQWRWVGNSTQRPGLKGRAKKLFYKAIRRGSEVIKIGDTTAFVFNTRHLKYIGRVISLWESWDGTMWVRVKWFYHPEEAKGGNRLVETKRALFESPHEDENDVQTISHKCDVMSYTEYTRYRQQTASGLETGSRNSQKSRDVYYLAGSYDPYAKQICSFEDDVKVIPN